MNLSASDEEEFDFPVSEIIEKFLNWQRNNNAPSTAETYGRHLKKFATFIGDRRVSRLKPYHLTEWLETLRPKYKAHSLASAVRSVKAALNWAEREGYILSTPLRSARAPQAAPREITYSPDQMSQIIDAAGPLRDFFIVLRETGCRPNELRILERRHVAGNKWVLPLVNSKGHKSRRVVFLTDRARKILENLAKSYPAGPLFRNSRGRPWHHNSIGLATRRISEKLKFRVIPYGVRHTFATDALIAGVDPVTVAVLMGHKDTTMIARVYSHLIHREEHLMESLEKALRGQRKQTDQDDPEN